MQEETTNTKSASGLKIAILVSTYHEAITTKLEEGARSEFIASGGIESNCTTISVVGAGELPLLAKTISLHNQYDALIALGCIITGETTHDQVIGHAIAQGLMQTSLAWGHPVSMGVLTCQTIEQAQARAGGSSGNKGVESMRAAIETEMSIQEQNA